MNSNHFHRQRVPHMLALGLMFCGCGDNVPVASPALDVLVGVPPADTRTSDVAVPPDSAAPDATPDIESLPDTGAGDVGTLDAARDVTPPEDVVVDARPNAAACPVPSLVEDYTSPLPPSPYAAWQAADSCLLGRHDAIIILGCPSRDDGEASTCQIQRVAQAMLFYEARVAPRFIVSGGAVHNAHVEADALARLLKARGIDDRDIHRDPLAEHTDENLYYATRIMQVNEWTSAVVVSDDPGHLLMTALCDSNCCVDLGRMTLRQFEVAQGLFVKAGHYVLQPSSTPNSQAECTHIESRLLCLTQSDRRACRSDFQLDE